MLTDYYPPGHEGEQIFTVDPRPIKFGPGAIAELGSDARVLGLTRAAVFTDAKVVTLEQTQRALAALRTAGVDHEVYAETLVEPTDASFVRAAEFMPQLCQTLNLPELPLDIAGVLELLFHEEHRRAIQMLGLQ